MPFLAVGNAVVYKILHSTLPIIQSGLNMSEKLLTEMLNYKTNNQFECHDILMLGT